MTTVCATNTYSAIRRFLFLRVDHGQ